MYEFLVSVKRHYTVGDMLQNNVDFMLFSPNLAYCSAHYTAHMVKRLRKRTYFIVAPCFGRKVIYSSCKAVGAPGKLPQTGARRALKMRIWRRLSGMVFFYGSNPSGKNRAGGDFPIVI